MLYCCCFLFKACFSDPFMYFSDMLLWFLIRCSVLLLISCVSDSLFCFLIRVSEFSVAWGKRGDGGARTGGSSAS